MSFKLLKRLKIELKDQFLHINASFATCHKYFSWCPQNRKSKPLYKKNDPTTTGNYRPASILSCISKIIEQTVKHRVTTFVENYKILYEHQFSFPKGHSTNPFIEIYM